MNFIVEEIMYFECCVMVVECDVVDWFIVFYLVEWVGGEFEGCIIGFMCFGVFVWLIEMGVDGLVFVFMFGYECFEYDEVIYVLVGMESGGWYCLGMNVKVWIEEVILIIGGLLLEMLIDFELGLCFSWCNCGYFCLGYVIKCGGCFWKKGKW